MSIKIGGVPATALQLEALRAGLGVPSEQTLNQVTTSLDTKYKVVRQFTADEIGSHFHTVPYDWRNIGEFSNSVTGTRWCRTLCVAWTLRRTCVLLPSS